MAQSESFICEIVSAEELAAQLPIQLSIPLPAESLSRTASPHHVHARLYRHKTFSWQLAIATVAEPHKSHLSLGGFRIAPSFRRLSPGFSALREAAELAVGMEEKVFWSREFGLAGPVGREHLARIVGGKCVLDPGDDHAVGREGDVALLEFAAAALTDFERETGIFIVTGQDLGHGMLTTGETSLHFLNERFRGCVQADTSGPTAYGNLGVVLGIARALGISLEGLRVGLVGCGNIGRHLGKALLERGSHVAAIDAQEGALQWCQTHGIEPYSLKDREEFLRLPLDVLCINASGRSLDEVTVEAISRNEQIRAVTGCENLIFSDPSLELRFPVVRKLFSPTEYCGMFGYLMAVETYLNPKVSDAEMRQSALAIAESANAASRAVLERDFGISMRQALQMLSGQDIDVSVQQAL